MSPATRGTLFLEDAKILDQRAFDGDQFVIRIEAPKCAAAAQPGCFVHVTVNPAIPMRRPLSIMRADSRAGWIEMLYRAAGPGMQALAGRKPGDTLSVLGPIGNGFTLHPDKPRALLVGAGYGNPPMVFLSQRLRADGRVKWKPLVLMGSEIPFPFRLRPSQILVPGMPDGVIACMPMLDEWDIPSRLATKADFPGCFDGFVPELADAWLGSLGPAELAEVEVFTCGPTPMVKAMAAVARKYRVACQVSLEEHMACAVGACAGCTVLVETEEGPAMKRVCVDGPVFDAYKVFAAA
jgi:dihydroorotate dehydrogenase electron transfer subunit